MIISKTPYRISFFGGGTDYPAWYLNEEGGGAVLSTTIDKYCYITCRILPPFFSARHRIVWSHIEGVSTISEILHPAVREGLRFLGFDDTQGIELHHQGDLPARAGIGSSSSFSVGLIKALTALKGRLISKYDLARKAMELEQDVLKDSTGSQDQVAAAFGGFNAIYFQKNGEFRVEPVTVPPARLAEFNSRLMLFYTGTNRLAGEIAAKVVAGMKDHRAQLNRMRGMVDRALAVLSGGQDLDALGELLHEAWMAKRGISSAVSNEQIDALYEKGRRAGALGGKLLGAGGTGFLCFYVPLDKREAVRQALSNCLWVPFKFETEGCSLLYYRPDQFESSAPAAVPS